MFIFLLKSTAILAVLLLFYKLFLEREQMPVIKRFYLLASLVAAFSIPLMVFTMTEHVAAIESPIIELTKTPEAPSNNYSFLPTLLWTIYGLGVALFAFKFLVNLGLLIFKIRRNPKIRHRGFINVLLAERLNPHTFFRYIFLNKYAFESNQIPEEIFLHEETHAKQMHSIDILLVELLQIFFWFNPLIYLSRETIKLNHEFLADQAVLNKGISTRTYLQTLLNYTQYNSPIELSSSLNHTPLKKRLTLMKTSKNKTSMFIKSLILLPLFGVLVLSFSEKDMLSIPLEEVTYLTQDQTLQQTSQNSAHHQTALNQYRSQYANYEKLRTAMPHFIDRTKDEQAILLDKHSALGGMYFRLDESAKKLVKRPINPIHPYYKVTANGKTTYKLKSQLTQEEYNAFPPPPPPAVAQEKATPAQLATYNKLAKKYNTMLKAGPLTVKKEEVTLMREIYAIMTVKQKKNAEAFPQLPPPPPPAPPMVKKAGDNPENLPPPPPAPVQVKATSAQLSTYNELAKKIDEKYKAKKVINLEQLSKIQDIYQVMSTDQKKNAAPYPRFSIAPPPPPTAPIIQKGGDNPQNIPPPPPTAPKVEKNGTNPMNIPPPPPPKISTDYMVEMAKKGAKFYYNGKKVSSKKAIQLVKNDEKIHIQVSNEDSKKPTIKLTSRKETD